MSIGSIILLILFILVVVAAGFAVYFYRQLSELKKNPQTIAADEVQTVVDRIGEILVLPEGEEPTLATVTAPERLQDQPFFAKAKVGDKVLLYAKARKAILYDPVAHKVVEVAPLNIGDSGNALAAEPPPAPAPTEETLSDTAPKDESAPDQESPQPVEL